MQPADQRRSAGTLQTRRTRLPWPADRPFRILSIDGGGIRGILPACFLAALEERFLVGDSVANYFDLIVGTSTGGILALGLSAGMSARQLAEIYVERGGEVFPDQTWIGKRLAGLRHILMTRCDHRALESLIAEILGTRALWQAGNRLCIPSIDATYGEVFVFKTPHHPDFRKDWSQPMAKVARATSAAQSFFKPLSDGTYTYLDGGIWANNPIMVGLVDALTCFDIEREQVRILSLGCVEDELRIGWVHRALGGKIFWPTNVIDGAMHLQSMNAVGQAGLLIGRDRLLRVNYPPIKPKLELHDWSACRRILPARAAELLERYGETIADVFLQYHAATYQPIYTPTNLPA